MRTAIILLIAALGYSASSLAAVVTFDDMPLTMDPCTVDPSNVVAPCVQTVSTPQGFVFSTTPGDPWYQSVSTFADGPTGNFLRSGAAYDFIVGIEITHESGQAFSVQSMDALIYNHFKDYELTPNGPVFVSTTPMEVAGFDEFGSQIAALSIVPPGGSDVNEENWTNVVFDSSFSTVYSVRISSQSISSPFGSQPQQTSIDNFAATVVPVPAAVWLFGSALAGLGWMRRKQTA